MTFKGFPHLFQLLFGSSGGAVSEVSVVGGQRGGLRVYRLLVKSKICLHNMPLQRKNMSKMQQNALLFAWIYLCLKSQRDKLHHWLVVLIAAVSIRRLHKTVNCHSMLSCSHIRESE